MRPVDEQTVLITGATDGLGKALAIDLAARGAMVLVHGRDDDRGRAALEEIREATGSKRLRWYRGDLAELAQVHALATAIARDCDRLDVVVSNAGIGTTVPGGGRRQESVDGYELRFAVNHLAGFALTRRLLPLLTASAPARVVHVSSAGQEPIDFDDVMLEHGYSGVRAYRQSKLAQIMFAFDLAEELPAGLVTVNALHPATYMPTKIVATPTSSLAEGVHATARLVIAPQLAGVTGRYFDGVRESRAHAQAYDRSARARLRALCERLAGLGHPLGTRPGETPVV